jgi:hypothetical protein
MSNLLFEWPAPMRGEPNPSTASRPSSLPHRCRRGSTGKVPGAQVVAGVSSHPRTVVGAWAAAVGGGAMLVVGRGGVATRRRRGGCMIVGTLTAVAVPFGTAAAGDASWVTLTAADLERLCHGGWHSLGGCRRRCSGLEEVLRRGTGAVRFLAAMSLG